MILKISPVSANCGGHFQHLPAGLGNPIFAVIAKRKDVRLALYPVDLGTAVSFPSTRQNQREWIHTIDLKRLNALKKWMRAVDYPGDYAPTGAVVRLDRKLKPGAYILEAQGGEKSAVIWFS